MCVCAHACVSKCACACACVLYVHVCIHVGTHAVCVRACVCVCVCDNIMTVYHADLHMMNMHTSFHKVYVQCKGWPVNLIKNVLIIN